MTKKDLINERDYIEDKISRDGNSKHYSERLKLINDRLKNVLSDKEENIIAKIKKRNSDKEKSTYTYRGDVYDINGKVIASNITISRDGISKLDGYAKIVAAIKKEVLKVNYDSKINIDRDKIIRN